MDEHLELVDLGDAKEETKGWNIFLPAEDNPAMPYGVFE